MEKYACELHMEAKVDFKNWISSGKPKHGPEYEHIKQTNTLFKYAVRFIYRKEEALSKNSIAKMVQQNNVYEFWKEDK